MRKIRFIAMLSCAVALAGCGTPRSGTTPGPTRVVRDDLGRRVVIPRTPRRIVCTSPEMTEVLFAVGAGDRVVGVSRGCDWPPAARRLPLVGDFSNVSGERVVALKPDLVVATGHEQSRIVAQLERFRLPVVAYMPADIAGVRRDITAVGDIVGKREEARKVLAAFDAELAAVDGRVAAVPYNRRPRVYLEISPEPLMTVARGSFVHEVIERAGGVNIGADLVRPYCRIDSEEVIGANPDVIISCHGGASPAAIRARPGWNAITAVRAGRVYDVDPDLVLRAGPRLSRGIATLYRLFYASPKAGEGL